MKRLLVLLIMGVSLAFAQTVEWTGTYNNGIQPSFNDYGCGVYQNVDYGYLVVGNTIYSVPTDSIPYLRWPYLIIKTDENGDEISKRMFCDSIGGIYEVKEFGEDTIAVYGGRTFLLLNMNGDSIYSFIPARERNESGAAFSKMADGSLLFVAGMLPDSGSATRIYNFSLSGILNWRKEYFIFGTTYDSGVYPIDIFPCSSGDFLISGTTLMGGRRWLMKINSVGDTLWVITPPITIISLLESAPNEFLCISGDRVCKIDGTGSILWTRDLSFGPSGYSHIFVREIVSTNDGNFVFCGSTGASGVQDGLIAKIDSAGNVIWSNSVDIGGRLDVFLSISQTQDSGYVCTGYSSINSGLYEYPESLEVCLVKFSEDGDIIWENGTKNPNILSLSVSPNPFNSACRISAPDNAIVEIFDLNGRIVYEMPVGSRPASTVLWQPNKSVPSGVYLVRAKIGDKNITKRVVYLK